ncbi:response regulator transcription factor, partial [Photorhabdus bodei]|uniref:response regulator transcription factor n=1 Tax=Photorhabdus bodei TaxID=2029681 RepID=UPI001E59E9EE
SSSLSRHLLFAILSIPSEIIRSRILYNMTIPFGIGSKHNKYYHEFMQPNNIQDIAEIFIRQHNRIIAGVSLLRDTPFTPKDFNRLSAILPLIELAVRDLLPETPTILTDKEQEIINLIREGSSNKRIAQILNISLSTVKTHLRNIFAKTKVTNRTELVSNGFITRHL